MKPGASEHEIAQLRHDLLTPINHILGFTEIQIEEAQEAGLIESVPVLMQINAGGRSLLAIVKDEFDPSDLARLSQRIESEARPALGLARKLTGQLQMSASQSMTGELDLVAGALENLLSLSQQMLRR